ncbi:MAG: hypothetical protein H7X70_02520 [Candidatus Kapabacteria bacterium]|nr:hypothetical protein [Candidatus Kapabacteria bacterium]
MKPHTSSVLQSLVFTIVALACAVVLHAQTPARLPVVTGISGYQTYFHAGTTIWMADGSVVYKNTPALYTTWSALPQLYRCASAFIVKAAEKSVTVIAKRLTQTDTSWWHFTSDDNGEFWKDSLPIDANGIIVGSTPQYLLFSDSKMDTTMSISVWRYDGTFATTVFMPNVHNTPFTTARLCGDSIIVSDPVRSAAAYDVIRNVDQEPATWTTRSLIDVVFGFVGIGNAFVFQTSQGEFVDHAGVVKRLGAFQGRLQDLFVDSLRGARIRNGALEITPDITGDSVRRISLGSTLIAGLDRIFTLRRSHAGIERGSQGVLELGTYVADINQGLNRLIPFINGTVTRGTTAILSGDRVLAANHFMLPNTLQLTPTISDFIAASDGRTLVVSTQMESSFGNTILKNVDDEVWAGTSDGTFIFPNNKRVSNRTIYDAVGNSERDLILTTRGIEIREGLDSTFRVFVDEQAPAGFAIAGDTLVVIRIVDITDDIPEARWVVDAYDRQGNVMFYGAFLVDSVVKKGLRFRSLSSTPFGLIVNGQELLLRSLDGGASWSTVIPNVKLTTPLSVADNRVCAWGVRPDGSEGPSLMITPERWVVQPTLMRTPLPVIACASMPGWFVFGTGDGMWHLKQTISSVFESPLRENSEIIPGTLPDEITICDLMGRIMSTPENLSTGWYVIVRRNGQTVHSQIRIIVR